MNSETMQRDANPSKRRILWRGILLGLASLVIGIAETSTVFAADIVPAGDSGQLVLVLQKASEITGLDANDLVNLQPLDANKALKLYGAITGTGCSDDAKTQEVSCPAYLVVNIVHWASSGASGAGDAHAPQSDWYLIHPTKNRSSVLTEPVLDGSLRIFGSRSVGILVVHVGISTVNAMEVKYTIDAKAKKSVQETDALSLFNLIVGSGSKTKAAGKADDYLVGARTITNIIKLPSDVIIAGAAYPKAAGAAGTDQKAAATFTQTYDDEGFAHWDVSVGIPVKGVSQVQYNSTDGIVQSKTVSKVNAYGLFHWYPYPVDLKGDYPWQPSIVGGLALTGKPLNKPFAGLAIGTKKPFPFRVNVFAGVVFNKVFSPSTLTTGSSASPGQLNNDLGSHWVRKLLVGIDIPIPQFVKAISKGATSN